MERRLSIAARAACARTWKVWVFRFVDGEESVAVGALFA